MKTIRVQSSKGRYDIVVGSGLLSQTGKLIRAKHPAGRSGKVMVVTQKRIPGRYTAAVVGSLNRAGYRVWKHYVPNGEVAKSQKTLFGLYRVLLKQDFERGDLLLALGGGVVGDLTGFTASTYMRGIAFVNVGTTLLAQVDSSIGGKTGINLEEGKNLVGTFNPPKLVICDIDVLKTLPARDFRSSMAEVVKYGVIRDARLFHLLEKNSRALVPENKKLLGAIVAICAKIKADVVSRDEREMSGERMILNYGHTFGHAFEKVLDYKKIMHGEAVSIGMVVAANLAVRLGLSSFETAARQENLLKDLKLPVDMKRYSVRLGPVMRAMMRDKKKSSGQLRFVLPSRIGRVSIQKGIAPARIRQMLKEAGIQG